jgi:hypothetical protein
MKITFLVLVFTLAPLAWSANTDAAEPFTLSVVPSRSSAQARSITIADNKPDEFYVVLFNTSKDAQPVFESWNSWGYQTVSLEFTTPDGKKTVVSRRPQDFTRNFPSTFLIQPGEHQVYAIRLDKSWETRPMFTADAETQITLKAIYQVSVTPESPKHKVWTGRIETKAYSLTLGHW